MQSFYKVNFDFFFCFNLVRRRKPQAKPTSSAGANGRLGRN